MKAVNEIGIHPSARLARGADLIRAATGSASYAPSVPAASPITAALPILQVESSQRKHSPYVSVWPCERLITGSCISTSHVGRRDMRVGGARTATRRAYAELSTAAPAAKLIAATDGPPNMWVITILFSRYLPLAKLRTREPAPFSDDLDKKKLLRHGAGCHRYFACCILASFVSMEPPFNQSIKQAFFVQQETLEYGREPTPDPTRRCGSPVCQLSPSGLIQEEEACTT